MTYGKNIREEELKNKVAQDYFKAYDNTKIIGNIDFCISVPQKGKEPFEAESLLWAEAKAGVKNIYESFVQLILTIGKARTFDKHIPPAFLGAFDAEKIGFLPYHAIIDVFYQNDFNWNVTPSDHETKEFKQLYVLTENVLENESLLFKFSNDDKELRRFIKENFVVGKFEISKIHIDKNNFVSVYTKWLEAVKPSIAVHWNKAKKTGVLDADFFLADLLSEENKTLKEKLYVLLQSDHYELDRKIDESGFLDPKIAQFNDKQKAHKQFWKRYKRPPKEEYWDYIVERRDLLVPQDIRERKGSFFTPRQWVELSQRYIADVLGENWQDEYYVWDCCAGTGNLLVGLTNKYNIWASTIDQADVDVMKDRIKNGANLLENHVFQFDFLNDPFTKLPQALQDVINDEEKRKKLVIYINPPYAEAGSGTGKNKAKVATDNLTYSKYKDKIKSASKELFAQFFIRIHQEINGCVLAEFSKLKILQANNFAKFRQVFKSKLEKNFIVPANTFDNVKGAFPIGFFIWDTSRNTSFKKIKADIYNANNEFVGHKNFYSNDKSSKINDWLSLYKITTKKNIGVLMADAPDFQNNKYVSILNNATKRHGIFVFINQLNLIPISIYIGVRRCMDANWLNDRDVFLYPDNSWKEDLDFQNNCLTFTLFNRQNAITSIDNINNWIPFTEKEVNAKEKFASNFMTDFIAGKIKTEQSAGETKGLFSKEDDKPKKLEFSPEAKAVFDAGRELWRYYHAQSDANVNASFYDIREYFQGRNEKGKMNNKSNDETYNKLIGTLREKMNLLARKIEPKVYEYGFLKK